MSNHPLQDKLSTAQRKLAAAAADDTLAAALNTAPMDRAACQVAIHRAYAHLRLAAPEVRFFDSPAGAMRELRQHAGLGHEVDLAFNGELNNAVISPAAWQPGWPSFSNLIDKRLGYQIHYAHAVSNTLEELAGQHDRARLLYWSGAASVWNATEDLARAQALVALGAVGAAPPELALGQAVLMSCGWINALKKVCLVCDRPQELRQEGRPRDTQGVRSQVIWRDGLSCEWVYHA